MAFQTEDKEKKRLEKKGNTTQNINNDNEVTIA